MKHELSSEHARVLGNVMHGVEAEYDLHRSLSRSALMDRGGQKLGARVDEKAKAPVPRLHLGDYLEAEAQPAAPSLWRGQFAGWSDPLGNNWCLDCGEAMVLHGIEAYRQFAGASGPGFVQQDALDLYGAVTGFVEGKPSTDRGTYSTDLIPHMINRGASCRADGSTHKWLTTIALDPSHVVGNMIALAEFVVIYRTLALPANAEGKQAWQVIGDGKTGDSKPGSWAYHFVPYLGFGPGYWITDSWGQLIKVDATFDLAYAYPGAGGGWVAISEDMLARRGVSPSGVNFTRMMADVRKLQGIG